MLSMYLIRHLMASASVVFSIALVGAQSFPIDFESDVTTASFVDFDGGTASVIANPQVAGINTSATVAQIVRDGGAVFAGSKLILPSNLDFTVTNGFRMKVFTTAPVGTTVKFKLEGGGVAERDVTTTVSNAWEELTWDFTGTPSRLNELVFMFDFGNVGDGSATSTFLFDDVTLVSLGSQVDLPVTFDDPAVNYSLIPFEGGTGAVVVDPTDASNMVGQANKPSTAGTSAGTTIGTSAGFASNIPLTLSAPKMNVRVWTPEAGTPIRLKVEDSNDPTRTVETESVSTVVGWETLEFDFSNEAPGTESLEVGLNMGWTYNKASIFFNFGTGGGAEEVTYFFDDIQFGGIASSTREQIITDVRISPNPAADYLIIETQDGYDAISIFSANGKQVLTKVKSEQNLQIDLKDFAVGLYFVHVRKGEATAIERVMIR